MKKTLLAITLYLSLAVISCTGDHTEKEGTGSNAPWVKPVAGTIIAADSIAIPDDLNNRHFSIKVTATDKAPAGTYDVHAAYGYDTALSSFTLPKGGSSYQPVMRRGDGPETFTIGFLLPGDTAFNDYFQVAGQKGMIMMKYIKAYSFEKQQ